MSFAKCSSVVPHRIILSVEEHVRMYLDSFAKSDCGVVYERLRVLTLSSLSFFFRLGNVAMSSPPTSRRASDPPSECEYTTEMRPQQGSCHCVLWTFSVFFFFFFRWREQHTLNFSFLFWRGRLIGHVNDLFCTLFAPRTLVFTPHLYFCSSQFCKQLFVNASVVDACGSLLFTFLNFFQHIRNWCYFLITALPETLVPVSLCNSPVAFLQSVFTHFLEHSLAEQRMECRNARLLVVVYHCRSLTHKNLRGTQRATWRLLQSFQHSAQKGDFSVICQGRGSPRALQRFWIKVIIFTMWVYCTCRCSIRSPGE